MDEKGIRQLRIEHLLAIYRQEGANRRALEKERARLLTLSTAQLAALQMEIEREKQDTGGAKS